MRRAKKARSDLRGGQGRVLRRPMPREGVVATIRVSGGRGRGGGMEVELEVELDEGEGEGGMVGRWVFGERENVRILETEYSFSKYVTSNIYTPPRPSPSFPSLLSPLLPTDPPPSTPPVPSNLTNPPATSAAAPSALVSASLPPTVCNLPNSHASFSIRVKDRMSSAARI